MKNERFSGAMSGQCMHVSRNESVHNIHVFAFKRLQLARTQINLYIRKLNNK